MSDPCAQNYLWRCKEKRVSEVGHTQSSHLCVPCSEAFLPSTGDVDADFQNDHSGSPVQDICRDILCDQPGTHKCWLLEQGKKTQALTLKLIKSWFWPLDDTVHLTLYSFSKPEILVHLPLPFSL